jgi:ABC-type branched-subunit amino acid transport system ATPase component
MTTASARPALADPTNELPNPLLSAEDLDFCYGRMQVLFGVSIHLWPGEALALLGTNGAGKSTLLRAISGLERPVGGRVIFDGQDVTDVPAERKVTRGLVLIPGGRAVFPDMNVEENLRMQALTVRKNRAWVRERRELVFATFPGLAERRSQPAGYLSGGEQQQLALAKALILDPKVLCIDELSLGLAPVVVGELIEIVSRIHLSGVALLVVEQSLNIAAELCPRTVFMEKGQVRFEGRTAELLERDDIARAVFLGEQSG